MPEPTLDQSFRDLLRDIGHDPKESVKFQIESISAIFGVLELVDVKSDYHDPDIVNERDRRLSEAVNGLGRLGSSLADSVFGLMMESFDELD